MRNETARVSEDCKMSILQMRLYQNIKRLKCLINVYKKSDIEIFVFASMKKLYNVLNIKKCKKKNFCTLKARKTEEHSQNGAPMPTEVELMYEVGMGLRRGDAYGFGVAESAYSR
ncbi:hypothetical protein M9H77_08616 [Catharanthus roseus]|uniref:Uncharacterized protein n=1 Tax=Catharanthus roseus TaxID=4058 RepID=A0ACC0BYN6_CATRO|nr:hypothetical protein M9H77_08616 [Catharanthus roseus]